MNRDELLGKYKDVDAFLYEHLDNLGHTSLNFTDRNFDSNEDVTALPDGVYKVYEASSKLLHYDVRVADNHIW